MSQPIFLLNNISVKCINISPCIEVPPGSHSLLSWSQLSRDCIVCCKCRNLTTVVVVDYTGLY